MLKPFVTQPPFGSLSRGVGLGSFIQFCSFRRGIGLFPILPTPQLAFQLSGFRLNLSGVFETVSLAGCAVSFLFFPTRFLSGSPRFPGLSGQIFSHATGAKNRGDPSPHRLKPPAAPGVPVVQTTKRG